MSLIPFPLQDTAPTALPGNYETTFDVDTSRSLDISPEELIDVDLTGEEWSLQAPELGPGQLELSVTQPIHQLNQHSSQLLSQPESGLNSTSYQTKDTAHYYQLYSSPAHKALRAFMPRKSPKSQFSLNRNYILCTLPTYPSMILPGNGETLPPFIHPQFNTYKALPGPLATCAVIMRWMSKRNEENVLSIWLCIRMEVNRIYAQACSLPESISPRYQ